MSESIDGKILLANRGDPRWAGEPKEKSRLKSVFTHLVHLARLTKTLAFKFVKEYQAGLTDPEPL